jgi:hypothetical protein
VGAAGVPAVTGYFQNTANFGGASLTSAGGFDGFLMRTEP